jgi:hypothetical protein
MKAIMKQEDKQASENQVPFFARFLEDQNRLSVKTGLRAGVTMRYPSDSDWG